MNDDQTNFKQSDQAAILLCLEGYPRSANSTLAWEILALCKKLHQNRSAFLHHSHAPISIRKAIVAQVPTFVLIREPVGAVSSYHIYSGAPIAECIKRWTEFYASIRGLSNRFTLIEFDDVVRSPRSVAAAVLSAAGLTIDGDDSHIELVLNEKKHLDPIDDRKSIEPREFRNKEKERILKDIGAIDFDAARKIYDFYRTQPRLASAEC
jgi:hypothetical protein